MASSTRANLSAENGHGMRSTWGDSRRTRYDDAIEPVMRRLYLIFLLAACGPSARDVETAYDLGKEVGALKALELATADALREAEDIHRENVARDEARVHAIARKTRVDAGLATVDAPDPMRSPGHLHDVACTPHTSTVEGDPVPSNRGTEYAGSVAEDAVPR